MLKSHFDAVERSLLATAQIPGNSGHMLHRGTPREAFIREFLQSHLSDRLAIGTGEIIDATSAPREMRNQHDIVVYRADYPKIDLGGGISAFLAESVVATIEVKSLLTADDLANAMKAATAAKKLKRNLVRSFSSGYVPPGIVSYLVAYAGPVKLATVREWIRTAETVQGLNKKPLPNSRSGRLTEMSEGLDGVFILGTRTILHDTAPIGSLPDPLIATRPDLRYELFAQAEGNLLLLFLLLTSLGSNVLGQWPDLTKYVTTNFAFEAVP